MSVRDEGGGTEGSTARRWGVRPMLARCVTALFGGYALSAVAASLVARLLPVSRVEATAWGMQLSFLFFAGVGLWCFRERRLRVIAAWVWGGAAAGVLLLWALGVRP